MKKLGSVVLLGGVAALLSACAWKAPMAEVTGVLYSPVNMYLYPTGILTIDGESTYVNPSTLTPGKHVLRVQGLGPTWSNAVKEFELVAEACNRYYIAAYRPAPNLPDWEPKIDAVLPISGCPKTQVAKN